VSSRSFSKCLALKVEKDLDRIRTDQRLMPLHMSLEYTGIKKKFQHLVWRANLGRDIPIYRDFTFMEDRKKLQRHLNFT
jgi:hypothetical protein